MDNATASGRNETMPTLIERTIAHVQQALAGDATGHDWWHVYRVWRLAAQIAKLEGADSTVVELAALLHDIADWKFADGDLQAGPRAAAAWLEEQQVDAATITAVCDIIERVSFKGAGVADAMPTLEGQIVQDADRLDALGAIGIARTFAYGGHRGQPMHAPDLPPEMHESFAAYQQGGGSSINHFYEKLLLLKDRMHTATGRRLALQRHAVMEQFLQQFHSEWEAKVDEKRCREES